MKKKSKLSSGVIALQRVKEGKVRQARALRKNMTAAEYVFWEHVRNRGLDGLKFRRQQIIEGYVADYFCEELKLVVEIDGGIHDTHEQKAIDKRRRNTFKKRGLREIRFKNSEVLKDIYSVLNTIKKLNKTSNTI